MNKYPIFKEMERMGWNLFGDDEVVFKHHVETLENVLENKEDYSEDIIEVAQYMLDFLTALDQV